MCLHRGKLLTLLKGRWIDPPTFSLERYAKARNVPAMEVRNLFYAEAINREWAQHISHFCFKTKSRVLWRPVWVHSLCRAKLNINAAERKIRILSCQIRTPTFPPTSSEEQGFSWLNSGPRLVNFVPEQGFRLQSPWFKFSTESSRQGLWLNSRCSALYCRRSPVAIPGISRRMPQVAGDV